MYNSTYIKKVIVEYHDGAKMDIIDNYVINQISGLMSLVSIEEQKELNELLNMESRNEAI